MSIVVLSAVDTGLTYVTLQSEIADYLHRNDLTDAIPGFISRAESYLFRELNIKELEVSVVCTTTAGGYGALPSDFGSVSRVTITNSSTWTLDYRSDPEVPDYTDANPRHYSLENNSIRIFGAGSGQSYTLTYIPKISALNNANSSNWLLANASDLYIYAACLEGARFIRDAVEVDKLTGMVATCLDSVRRYSERRGHPSNGSLQIKTRRYG